MLSACGEQEYTTTIGWHNEVLACWQGDRMLSPTDCIGKEVVAYPLTEATGETDKLVGQVGMVVAESHEGYLQLPSFADGSFLVGTWAIYAPLLDPDEWLSLHKNGEVPLLPHHSTAPLPRFVPQDGTTTEPHVIEIPVGNKPDETAARATLKEFVLEFYRDPIFSFFDEEPFYRVPLIWLDIDGDGRSEALTLVTTYDEAKPDCTADLLIVSFDDSGHIKDREKLAATKRANPCSMPNLGFGGSWSIQWAAWPGSARGATLAVESGMDSGDGYALYVLEEMSAEVLPRIAADYLYVWDIK